MIKCNLCNELNVVTEKIPHEYLDIVNSGGNIILSSRDLVVIPSFGPLNSTHAMIVPRKHVYNFSSLTKDYSDQINSLISQLKDGFYKKYNKSLVFFESGAGNITNHAGGCIVHAHLHCVVENKTFENNLFKKVELEAVDDTTIFNTLHGYIWYQSSDGHEYVKNNPLLPSQFLRYLYMQSSNEPQPWNWRRNIDIHGIKSVIDTYSKIFD